MDSAAKSLVTKHALPPRLALADGVVYASQRKLYALDATTGALRWRAFTSTDLYVAMSARVTPLNRRAAGGDDDQPA
ncbi:MAG: hypothetical protein ACRDHE_07870 [Ktedonobacterales bacterium]